MMIAMGMVYAFSYPGTSNGRSQLPRAVTEYLGLGNRQNLVLLRWRK